MRCKHRISNILNLICLRSDLFIGQLNHPSVSSYEVSSLQIGYQPSHKLRVALPRIRYGQYNKYLSAPGTCNSTLPSGWLCGVPLSKEHTKNLPRIAISFIHTILSYLTPTVHPFGDQRTRHGLESLATFPVALASKPKRKWILWRTAHGADSATPVIHYVPLSIWQLPQQTTEASTALCIIHAAMCVEHGLPKPRQGANQTLTVLRAVSLQD